METTKVETSGIFEAAFEITMIDDSMTGVDIYINKCTKY